jgi:hypothetical protein
VTQSEALPRRWPACIALAALAFPALTPAHADGPARAGGDPAPGRHLAVARIGQAEGATREQIEKLLADVRRQKADLARTEEQLLRLLQPAGKQPAPKAGADKRLDDLEKMIRALAAEVKELRSRGAAKPADAPPGSRTGRVLPEEVKKKLADRAAARDRFMQEAARSAEAAKRRADLEKAIKGADAELRKLQEELKRLSDKAPSKR